MKIDAFIEQNDKWLIQKRKMYIQSLQLEVDKARKRYFAYRSHKNLELYLAAKKKLRNRL